MPNKPTPQEMAAQAKQTYQDGDYELAARSFAEAAMAYSEAGDALMSAELKNNQCVALLRTHQPKEALEVVQGTDQVFAQAGDLRRQGMSLANLATTYEALKRSDEMIDTYKAAAEVLEKAGEGDLRAEVMQLLSTHYLRRFKFYEAAIALQSGLAGVKNPTLKQRFMKKILFVRM
jgi:tetratricopeptide (TPR) repeat protein